MEPSRERVGLFWGYLALPLPFVASPLPSEAFGWSAFVALLPAGGLVG
jgi:hypothetical protein